MGKLKGDTVALICPTHGYTEGSHCPECVKDKAIKGPAVHIWKSMWFNDITDKPIYVESKRQLKQECKKHNVTAARLL